MRFNRASLSNTFTVWMILLGAVLCGSVRAGAATFTVGGTLSGLKATESVTLFDNGGNSLKLTANGAFKFSTPLATGKAYKVTVDVQPAGQLCTVTAGAGTVAAAKITSVKVACANAYSIGGTLSGLTAKESIVLVDNDLSPLTLKANGKFAFATPLLAKAAYKVTVKTQPSGEMCTVTKGSGTVAAANIASVAVTCVKVFAIGGTVTGLTAGKFVTLLENGASPDQIDVNGRFTLKTELPSKAAYKITVSKQPVGETCTILKGTGTVGTVNVTTIAVNCEPTAKPTYSIGGAVTGLTAGTVTLLDNGGNSTPVSSNTSFTFSTKIATGKTYAVTVGTQPTGQTCTVANGSGTVAAANITNVAVACAANTAQTYSIGGSVSGLSSGKSVTLTLNGAGGVTVSSNTTFAFGTKLASGTNYAVAVSAQPTGETCTVGANGTGKVASANITNVAVTCSASSGGGSGGSFWMPFIEQPANGASDGLNGLLLVPSGTLTSSPTPSIVTTEVVNDIGPSFQYSDSGGNFTFSPQGYVYSAADKNGNQQIYYLNLAPSSKAPEAVQLGNAAISPSLSICNSQSAQTDLTDPTTFFVLLEVGDPNSCDPTTDTFEVVHYSDAPTKAPTVVNVDSASFDTLYSNGQLSGLVLYDYFNNDIKFFSDDTFTSPKTLFTGVSDNNDLSVGALTRLSTLTSEGLYTIVSTASNSTTANTLYYISNSGVATKVLAAGAATFDANYGIGDDNNIYFGVIASSGGTSTETFYQVPAGGTSTTTLYSKTLASGESLELIGSNDSVVVFEDDVPATTGTTPTPAEVLLESLPVGKTSSTPTQITSAIKASTGKVIAFLSRPLNGTLPDAKLFVDVLATSKSGASWSSFALDPASTATPTPTANSFYSSLGGGVQGDSLTGGVLQITGITDTTGQYGGGTLYQTDVTTLANTAFTTTGGGPYKVPAGYEVGLVGISSSGLALGYGLNPNEFNDTTLGSIPGRIGLPADLNKNFILTIQATDTDVQPIL